MYNSIEMETRNSNRSVETGPPLIPEYETIDTSNEFSVELDMVDLVHDLNAGILLSYIIKLFKWQQDIEHSDEQWITLSRSRWYEVIKLSPRQFDRALKHLLACNLVVTKKVFLRNRVRILIRLNEPYFSDAREDFVIYGDWS